MSESFRDVQIDNQCWSLDGNNLGTCIFKGLTSDPRDPDPVYKFSSTGEKEFIGFLPYKKVPCNITTGGKRKRKSIKRKRQSKKNKYRKSKKHIKK
jgi:hypothetical protein